MTPSPSAVDPAPPSSPPASRRILGRWRAVLVITLAAAVLGLIVVRGLHPFLACTAPVPAKTLVIEGWTPDYAMEAGVEEFRRGNYDRIIITGGPIERGRHLASYQNFAMLGAASLQKLGLPTNCLLPIPSRAAHRNRTFGSAMALREYCNTNHLEMNSVNLITLGTHARRSRLCFQRALGRRMTVGVISIEDRAYDANRWCLYSAGVKAVAGETLACLYAWLSIDFGD